MRPIGGGQLLYEEERVVGSEAWSEVELESRS